MNCKGIERPVSPAVCIVGYGNPHRRDDGLGPYILAQLESALAGCEAVRTMTCHQLIPELVEEIEGADLLILVDASALQVTGGLEWREVKPDLGQWHPVTHQLTPSFFLGLADALYKRHPMTWLVSVQGEDFELGEGLSLAARKRAIRAAEEIAAFVEEWMSLRHGVVLALREGLVQNLAG
jgi:hydrogenase maturation protease